MQGEYNSYNAEFWQYDPRIGRRWNLDPRPTLGISPYAAFNNSPILFADPHGDTSVAGAGGGNIVDIDEKVNRLEFYGSGGYTSNGKNVRVQPGQLRSFTNDIERFAAKWNMGRDGATFAGYLNDKNQTLEAALKEINKQASSLLGRFALWAQGQYEQSQVDPLSYNLKLSTNLLVGAAMTATEPIPYVGGHNPSVSLSERSGQAAWLLRRGENIGAFAALEVPMQMRTVKSVAEQAGVGLKGVKLSIVRDPDLIGRSVYGLAHRKSVTLYPDAFRNYETLVKTLGHERTHIFQFSLYGAPKSSSMGAQLNKQLMV